MDGSYVRVMFIMSSIFSLTRYNGGILIESPKKIITSIYKCDKHFHLDNILEMYKSETKYGMVFVNGSTYLIYKIIKSGNHIQEIKLTDKKIKLAKKHNKGGQSQVRFSRLREESHNNYINIVSERIIQCFKYENLEYLFIIGNGEKKKLLYENILVKEYFGTIIKMITINEISEETVKNTIYDQNIFTKYDINNKNLIINEIEELLLKDYDKLLFGVKEINENKNEIKKIYIDIKKIKDLNDINPKCEIIDLEETIIKRINLDAIGIKYY